MLRQIRFHGRGGEGVKLASRIATRAGFLAGWEVQDSPLYGAERRGAPVVASARIGDEILRERGYVSRPDAVVVMDSSLLGDPQAGVLDGADGSTAVLVNSPRPSAEVKSEHALAGPVVCLDVSPIALDLLGHHLLGAPMAGFALKALGLASWEVTAEAARFELEAIGLRAALIEKNIEVMRPVFGAAPILALRARRATTVAEVEPPFVVRRVSATFAAPSIDAGATSELRRTSGWRVERPVIDLSRCTRCFLCFALCPEGAIRLDAQNFPVVDYDHCKGCLVCVEECPPQTIRREREAAA